MISFLLTTLCNTVPNFTIVYTRCNAMACKLCGKVAFVIKLTTPAVLKFLNSDFVYRTVYSISIRKDEFLVLFS